MSQVAHQARAYWVLSIVSNWPVRDRWEYLRKMEQHFPIKSGQPIEIAVVILILLPNSQIRAKNRFVINGMVNFSWNIATKICGPPLEAIFRSEETEMNLSIWIPTEISRIFGIMGSTHCMPVSVAWGDVENFYSPLDGLLVHCRVTLTIL